MKDHNAFLYKKKCLTSLLLEGVETGRKSEIETGCGHKLTKGCLLNFSLTTLWFHIQEFFASLTGGSQVGSAGGHLSHFQVFASHSSNLLTAQFSSDWLS